MITLIDSVTVGPYTIQYMSNGDKVPATFTVLVTKDGKQISSYDTPNEGVAIGIFEGYKVYYSSDIN